MKFDLLTHRAVDLQYLYVFDYETYRLSDRLPRYDSSADYYFSMVVEKLTSQANTHTFDPTDQVIIMSFLKKFKLQCNVDCVYEGASLSAVPSFVADSVGCFL